MSEKFTQHLEIFVYWLEHFEEVCFDCDSEDKEEIRVLLQKLINKEKIDEAQIELLYSLSLDNAYMQKSDFIKFQAKKLVNFLNEEILQNVDKESL